MNDNNLFSTYATANVAPVEKIRSGLISPIASGAVTAKFSGLIGNSYIPPVYNYVRLSFKFLGNANDFYVAMGEKFTPKGYTHLPDSGFVNNNNSNYVAPGLFYTLSISGDGFNISTDNGDTWEKRLFDTSLSNFNDLLIGQNGIGYVLATFGGRYYISVFDVATGNEITQISTNVQTTWQTGAFCLFNGEARYFFRDPNTKNVACVFCNESGNIETVTIPAAQIGNSFTLGSAVQLHGSIVLISGQKFSSYHIAAVSADGGYTWTAAPPFVTNLQNLKNVFVDGDAVTAYYVNTSSSACALWRSYDGLTWFYQSLLSPPALPDRVYAYKNYMYYIMPDGKTYQSPNAWGSSNIAIQPVPSLDLPNAPADNIAFSPDGGLLVTTGGSRDSYFNSFAADNFNYTTFQNVYFFERKTVEEVLMNEKDFYFNFEGTSVNRVAEILFLSFPI